MLGYIALFLSHLNMIIALSLQWFHLVEEAAQSQFRKSVPREVELNELLEFEKKNFDKAELSKSTKSIQTLIMIDINLKF